LLFDSIFLVNEQLLFFVFGFSDGIIFYYFCSMQQWATNTKEQYKEDSEIDVLEITTHPFNLIVWNDEVNTFDWVIETLMEVCNHTEEQAEQCALLIHFKGKYAVKNGDYDTLKPMCNSITERGINATVEKID